MTCYAFINGFCILLFFPYAQKGKRTPNSGGQYGASSSNACSPKAAKKAMALVGSPSPIASPSASPQPSAVIQQVCIHEFIIRLT